MDEDGGWVVGQTGRAPPDQSTVHVCQGEGKVQRTPGLEWHQRGGEVKGGLRGCEVLKCGLQKCGGEGSDGGNDHHCGGVMMDGSDLFMLDSVGTSDGRKYKGMRGEGGRHVEWGPDLNTSVSQGRRMASLPVKVCTSTTRLLARPLISHAHPDIW